jgi:hypothetical protein
MIFKAAIEDHIIYTGAYWCILIIAVDANNLRVGRPAKSNTDYSSEEKYFHFSGV